jgi:cytochrome c peroxidase
MGRLADDGRVAITGRPEDRGAFKTPTLREIARTAPYMHDGTLATLADVVDFYNRGGHLNPHLDPEIRPLNLAADESHALLVFLGALTGDLQEGN